MKCQEIKFPGEKMYLQLAIGGLVAQGTGQSRS